MRYGCDFAHHLQRTAVFLIREVYRVADLRLILYVAALDIVADVERTVLALCHHGFGVELSAHRDFDALGLDTLLCQNAHNGNAGTLGRGIEHHLLGVQLVAALVVGELEGGVVTPFDSYVYSHKSDVLMNIHHPCGNNRSRESDKRAISLNMGCFFCAE